MDAGKDQSDEIDKREAYLEKFLDDPVNITPAKQVEALRYAHEIRKFEIELYWRRAAYFWTFIAAAFGAFFLLEEKGNTSTVNRFIVACLGFVFSFAWYLANRGSKYWQDNWEQHVDLLEDKITGPLYKMNAEKQAGMSKCSLLDAYPFSVSRINQVLNLFVIAIWLTLLLEAITAVLCIEPHWGAIVSVIATGIVSLISLWALICKTETRRTGGGAEFKIHMRLRKRGE